MSGSAVRTIRSARRPGAISPALRRLRRSSASEEIETRAQRDFFRRSEFIAVARKTRSGGNNRGERLAGCDRRVGAGGDLHPRVEQAARAIKPGRETGIGGVLGPTVIDEAGIGHDPHTQRRDMLRVAVRDQPAMFDSADDVFERPRIDFAPRRPDRDQRRLQLFDLGRMEGDIESLCQRIRYAA